MSDNNPPEYATANEVNNLHEDVRQLDDKLDQMKDDILCAVNRKFNGYDLFVAKVDAEFKKLWKALQHPSRTVRFLNHKLTLALVPVILAGSMAWGTAVYVKADNASHTVSEQCPSFRQLRDEKFDALNESVRQGTISRDQYIAEVRALPVVKC